jgi:hypothetical protein
MCTWHPNQNGSETGVLDKYRDDKCYSFSACKGQHTNANLSGAYCHVWRTCYVQKTDFLFGALHSNSDVLIVVMNHAWEDHVHPHQMTIFVMLTTYLRGTTPENLINCGKAEHFDNATFCNNIS